ncbi:MAG TPA: hypothetical protein VHW01_25300 [Polyangiaceae bacterium]|jgi:hypothetical protein|nr:hypothetical protein [Polyangiaceae bacterium]
MFEHRRLVGCLRVQLVACSLLCPGLALAGPKDSAATKLDNRAMQTDYLATDFKKAEEKLKKALAACGKSACSSELVAQLHRDLATVYIAGTKQVPKGKSELKLALAADPDLQLDKDLTTPELRKAFLAAGGHVKEAQEDKPPPDEDKASDESDKKEEAPAPDAEPAEAPGKGQRNWLSVHFEQDFLLYPARDNVCASNASGTSDAPQYACFQSGSRFGYTPGQDIRSGPGNHVASGVGVATSRVLLGFDRLLSSNVSIGARAGFAFRGGPGGKFLPFHGELRANYWFGTDPFESSGLRPYVSLSAGIAEVEADVLVQYYTPAGEKASLAAWRSTGKGFAGLGLGTMIPFAESSGIVPEVRAMEMLGASALAFDVALGYAYGF